MNNPEFTRDIYQVIGSILKPYGFRKKGGNFSFENDEVIQLIQLQKSDVCKADFVRFTINIGVHSKQIDTARGILNALPWGAVGAHYYRRISALIGDGRGDPWIEVRTADDAVRGKKVVAEMLRENAIPFLLGVRTSKDLLIAWTEKSAYLGPALDRDMLVAELSAIVHASQ